jgi:hypothetical protein
MTSSLGCFFQLGPIYVFVSMPDRSAIAGCTVSRRAMSYWLETRLDYCGVERLNYSEGDSIHKLRHVYLPSNADLLDHSEKAKSWETSIYASAAAPKKRPKRG